MPKWMHEKEAKKSKKLAKGGKGSKKGLIHTSSNTGKLCK